MNIVLNEQKDGFAERIPCGGCSPFRVGERTAPTAGDFVFIDPEERKEANALLAQYYGLKVGRWLAYRKYLVEVA